MKRCSWLPPPASVAHLFPDAMNIVQVHTVHCDLNLVDVNKSKFFLTKQELEDCE